MRILWVKTDFLHPTTRGGQIRTLEILRCLHRCHEIHYVAFEDPKHPQAVQHSVEYCSRAYPVRHKVPEAGTAAFLGQLSGSIFSSVPVVINRYRSPAMQRTISGLLQEERFDRIVCDFLSPSMNFQDFKSCILFQHNVETLIWQRRADHASEPLHRLYFRLQARRMFDYERRACRAAKHVMAVSANDADLMRSLFDVSRLSVVPTGVDIDHYSPPPSATTVADLIFVGSMDWRPNIDGVHYFVREIFPLIRRRRPNCSLAIAGRTPPKEISGLSSRNSNIVVTGTVPDIRPYLWGSLVSIVPLRIGGGTRLKIYESMAARIPVVSTTVGAEGLEVSSPENIRLADTPKAFADQCLQLLNDPAERFRIAAAAFDLVSSRFTWKQAAAFFERALESAGSSSAPPQR